MTDKVKAKIAKLLNMTVENGCTEDEAESALRMAAGIAAREGIELDSLRAKDAPKPKAQFKRMSQAYKPHQAFAAAAAAVLFGVECNYLDFGKHGVTFVGREENIELTEQTWFWIMRQVEELYKIALPKGMTKVARGEYRRTFKEACALRVKERAEKLMREMRRSDAAAQSATGHNAVAVMGHFDQLEKENAEFWSERYKASGQVAKRYQDAEEARRAAMSPEERAKLEDKEKKERDKWEKKAAKAKPRRERTLRRGIGTESGFAAAEQVKLRDEVK